jgi:hypothetical protein
MQCSLKKIEKQWGKVIPLFNLVVNVLTFPELNKDLLPVYFPFRLPTFTLIYNICTGDSSYARGLGSCESPRISKARKMGNVKCPWIFLSDSP